MQLQVDLSSAEVNRCPFATYDRLRADAPVYRDPGTGHYVLTRFADVRAALLQHRTLSNTTGIAGAGERAESRMADHVAQHGWPLTDALQSTDRPVHNVHRALVAHAFSAPAVAALEPSIAVHVDRLLDAIVGRGEVDFVASYALPFPLRITAELMGFAAADEAKMRHWATILVEATAADIAPDRERPIAESLIEMQHFFAANIERVRATPEDTIFGRLVASADQHGIAMPALMNIAGQMISGHESIASSLSSGVQTLIERPALADELRNDPARIPDFIEEVLRAYAPVQGMFRRVLADMEIDGVAIPAGAIVEVRYGAANRDPQTFADPDAIDLDRPNAGAHLTFGAGIHLCIANQLVRAELRLTFERLLARSTAIRYARPDSWSLNEGYVTYGPNMLLCVIEAAG